MWKREEKGIGREAGEVKRRTHDASMPFKYLWTVPVILGSLLTSLLFVWLAPPPTSAPPL